MFGPERATLSSVCCLKLGPEPPNVQKCLPTFGLDRQTFDSAFKVLSQLAKRLNVVANVCAQRATLNKHFVIFELGLGRRAQTFKNVFSNLALRMQTSKQTFKRLPDWTRVFNRTSKSLMVWSNNVQNTLNVWRLGTQLLTDKTFESRPMWAQTFRQL